MAAPAMAWVGRHSETPLVRKSDHPVGSAVAFRLSIEVICDAIPQRIADFDSTGWLFEPLMAASRPVDADYYHNFLEKYILILHSLDDRRS